MRLTAVVFALVLTGACSNSLDRSERLDWLAKVAKKCGLPPSSLTLVGMDELRFIPPADAPHQRVDCAIAELKRAPFSFQMGFVGNEVYEPEKN